MKIISEQDFLIFFSNHIDETISANTILKHFGLSLDEDIELCNLLNPLVKKQYLASSFENYTLDQNGKTYHKSRYFYKLMPAGIEAISNCINEINIKKDANRKFWIGFFVNAVLAIAAIVISVFK